jgi:hypothetical protein
VPEQVIFETEPNRVEVLHDLSWPVKVTHPTAITDSAKQRSRGTIGALALEILAVTVMRAILAGAVAAGRGLLPPGT